VTADPKSEPSISNCTEPVGVGRPADDGLTVAVKVKDWPYIEVCVLEATVIVVSAGLTIWLPVRVPLLGLIWPVLEVKAAVTRAYASQ